MYMAAINGENVLDKAEIISDEILASIVGQMHQGFEATNIEWAEGLYRTLIKILQPASPEARDSAREHLKGLLDAA